MSEQLSNIAQTLPVNWEFIDCIELALRWSLPISWVRDQVRRRVPDPLPHVKFGKYVRFRWGSPELETWAERRIVGPCRPNRAHRNETAQ